MVPGGRNRHDQDPAAHLGHHQPVCRGFGRIKQWSASPCLIDVVQAEVGMFEEVNGLSVDLERVVAECIGIEKLVHPHIV